MPFINGIGYVDDIIPANTITKTAALSPETSVQFQNLLEEENARLSGTGKSYDLAAIYKEAAETYGISEDLLKAIGYVESRFDPNATSGVGAMGIMQLMPDTAAGLGVTDAYDPYENIMGAAKLLKGLSDMYGGDISLMAAAYNAGSGNVAKYGGVPPFEETQNYVAQIKRLLSEGVELPGNVNYNAALASMQGAGTEMSDLIALMNADARKKMAFSAQELKDALNEQQYRMLMVYFENMTEIIASIGRSDDSDSFDSNDDDSLQDLFRLANSYTQATKLR